MKSPKVSYEEKEMTVGDTLRWLDKLEKVTSKGAKIAMVSMLLRRNQSDTLKRVREGLPKKEPIKVTKKNIGKPDLVFQYCRGYNAAIDEVLSLISGMKKEL